MEDLLGSLWCAVEAKAFEALPMVPLLLQVLGTSTFSTSTCICARTARAVACLPRLDLELLAFSTASCPRLQLFCTSDSQYPI